MKEGKLEDRTKDNQIIKETFDGEGLRKGKDVDQDSGEVRTKIKITWKCS